MLGRYKSNQMRGYHYSCHANGKSCLNLETIKFKVSTVLWKGGNLVLRNATGDECQIVKKKVHFKM